ncbi:NPCBM/NEW2 domain-containing protein [Streptomyces sp. ACA25]|uniref:NPCBM/NEW2 domain-containing protein n=1 Tax=Streptomyces sp. ACA25 TaxID=3022596 RepID=UPI0023070D70|nr:NPCBM/NEW2 domain-containing protein [Streptomyces sp. ACA25]MDB1090158.1 NPCBM/NEW2 domain-containing protein [Streptomyces sp. ACA25]
MADLALVDRMRVGDAAAYQELYRRHGYAVRRYARLCCRDVESAGALTDEVFSATWRAVRGGAGPETAVRAYLLTSVRWIAAGWAGTPRRERLVEEFAEFAVTAVAAVTTGRADGVAGRHRPVPPRPLLRFGAGLAGPGAPVAQVQAMLEAERSMIVRAYRSLPQRWQTVLWHTAAEDASAQRVAMLVGLTPEATTGLAHRAREGLRQAYLQAHVSRALAAGGDCARHADQLGAFVTGGLRMRVARALCRHLAECTACGAAAEEAGSLDIRLRAVLPVAVIGWLAPRAAPGSGAGAGSGGSGGAGGRRPAGGGGPAAGGLAAAVKAGLAATVTVAVTATVLAMALLGGSVPGQQSQSLEPPSAPPGPRSPLPETGQGPEPAAPREEPPAAVPEGPVPGASGPAAESVPEAVPEPTPGDGHAPGSASGGEREPEALPPAPATVPVPQQEQREWERDDATTGPVPGAPPEGPAEEPGRAAEDAAGVTTYVVAELPRVAVSDGRQPAVRSGWLWQRHGLAIGGRHYAHGVTLTARTSVSIDLNRACTSYRARAGIDDLSTDAGAAVLSAWGDGKLLWRSEVLRSGEAAVPLHVPLAGVRTLRLDARPHGVWSAAAFADWAESEISCR